MSAPKGPRRNSARPMSIRDLARKLTREEQFVRGNTTDDSDDDFHNEVSAPPRKGHRATGLREGASRMMASDLGIDPDLAAKAGPAAAKVLGALSDANNAEDSAEKTRCIRRAQKHLQTIDPTRHGPLVQQLQARLLAAQGRGGDTEVAHVTPGELVIPPNLQTPEILSLLQEAAFARGIDITRLFVGSEGNSINPRTGAGEFAFVGRGDPLPGTHLKDPPGFGMGGWPNMGGSIVEGWANDGGFSGNGFGYNSGNQLPQPPEGIETITVTAPYPKLLAPSTNRNITINNQPSEGIEEIVVKGQRTHPPTFDPKEINGSGWLFDYLKVKERFEPTPYPDAGYFSIGYGHQIGETKPEDLMWTKEQAEEQLRLDIDEAAQTVRDLVKVPLTQDQFDSLTSLVFNVGRGNFHMPNGKNVSNLLTQLNTGNYLGAAQEMLTFRKSEGRINPGLQQRRLLEAKHFLGPDAWQLKPLPEPNS